LDFFLRQKVCGKLGCYLLSITGYFIERAFIPQKFILFFSNSLE